jgi:hypothetical protein
LGKVEIHFVICFAFRSRIIKPIGYVRPSPVCNRSAVRLSVIVVSCRNCAASRIQPYAPLSISKPAFSAGQSVVPATAVRIWPAHYLEPRAAFGLT